jgi:hypothetical protein
MYRGYGGSVFRIALVGLVLAAAVSACNRGGGTTPPAGATPSPSPGTSATPAASATVTTSTTEPTLISGGPFNGGYDATITVPATNAVAHIQVAVSQTQPAGTPIVQNTARKSQNINAADTPFGYLEFTADTDVVLPENLLVVWKFPAGVTPPDPTHSYIAAFNPLESTAGWNLLAGPATESNDANGDIFFAFPEARTPLTLVANTTYYLVLFSSTSTLTTPAPGTTASPSGSPTATPEPDGFNLTAATDAGNETEALPEANGSTASFSVLVTNGTGVSDANFSVAINVGILPLNATVCQTVAATGQCIAPPQNAITASFPAGQSETFAVFLTAEGIPINGGIISVLVEDTHGGTTAETNVTVDTL